MAKLNIGSLLRLCLILFLAWNSFIPSVKSQTVLANIIASDSTFSPENNPYIISTDLTILKGATLTLLPGVELLFEQGTGLICKGNLIAKGTSDNKIKFLPKSQISTAGQWIGITMNNAATTYSADSMYLSGSVFSECEISSANFALTLDKNSSLLIEKVNIAQSSFAVNILGSANNVIRNCTITDANYGIFLADGLSLIHI